MERLQYGDYVMIEQFRYGVKNEMYLHKVVNTFQSNQYTPVPVKNGEGLVNAGELVDVVNVICCGVDETKVYKVRVEDCRKVRVPNLLAYKLDCVELSEAKSRMAVEEANGRIEQLEEILHTIHDFAGEYAAFNTAMEKVQKMVKEGLDA